MNTYIRELDEFNRIALPMEVQKQLGLKNGDSLNLTQVNDRIVVIPKIPCCAICKGPLDNEKYGVCEPCARLIINH